MPKVTIYARPVDGEVWEWARLHADEDRVSLARVVADALRAYRERCEKTAADLEDER